MSSQEDATQPMPSKRARMGCTVPLRNPVAATIFNPYRGWSGSASST
ncbi:MAG TPA: hypothetical protein VH395_09345 [Jatrophihabitantaceae bacterium]|jgi:hypothetical protein